MKLLVQAPHLTDEETEAQKEAINGLWSQGEFRGKAQVLRISGQFFFHPVFLAPQTEPPVENTGPEAVLSYLLHY